jgi:hypothetical protein
MIPPQKFQRHVKKANHRLLKLEILIIAYIHVYVHMFIYEVLQLVTCAVWSTLGVEVLRPSRRFFLLVGATRKTTTVNTRFIDACHIHHIIIIMARLLSYSINYTYSL